MADLTVFRIFYECPAGFDIKPDYVRGAGLDTFAAANTALYFFNCHCVFFYGCFSQFLSLLKKAIAGY